MTAVGVSGLAAIALVWLLAQFGIDMPEVVAGAFVGCAAWVAGYIKRERITPGSGKHAA